MIPMKQRDASNARPVIVDLIISCSREHLLIAYRDYYNGFTPDYALLEYTSIGAERDGDMTLQLIALELKSDFCRAESQ